MAKLKIKYVTRPIGLTNDQIALVYAFGLRK